MCRCVTLLGIFFLLATPPPPHPPRVCGTRSHVNCNPQQHKRVIKNMAKSNQNVSEYDTISITIMKWSTVFFRKSSKCDHNLQNDIWFFYFLFTSIIKYTMLNLDDIFYYATLIKLYGCQQQQNYTSRLCFAENKVVICTTRIGNFTLVYTQ